MATLDLNDIIRIVLSWNLGTNTKAQMVWHYKVTSGSNGVPSAALTAIDTAVDTAWAHIAGNLIDDLVATKLEMFKWDFTNNRWDGVAVHTPTGLDGGAAGDYYAPGCAALVKILTGQNRRQGRKFIPGLREAVVTDGALTGAALVNFADFAAAFDIPVTAAGITYTWCTFNTEPTSPLFETDSLAVQSVVAEATVAYQRRRKPGVGLT